MTTWNYCHECSGQGESEWCEDDQLPGDQCDCDDENQDSHDMIACEACDGTGEPQDDDED
tara:strand:- start:9050 stop:9229 length:180 start_codon:yes stop_codon:yes gene_type:complete